MSWQDPRVRDPGAEDDDLPRQPHEDAAVHHDLGMPALDAAADMLPPVGMADDAARDTPGQDEAGALRVES